MVRLNWTCKKTFISKWENRGAGYILRMRIFEGGEEGKSFENIFPPRWERSDIIISTQNLTNLRINIRKSLENIILHLLFITRIIIFTSNRILSNIIILDNSKTMSRIFFFFFNSHSPHTYSLRTNAATFNNQAWKRRERKTKQNKRNIIYNLTNELKIGSRPVYPVFFRHNLHSPNGRMKWREIVTMLSGPIRLYMEPYCWWNDFTPRNTRIWR